MPKQKKVVTKKQVLQDMIDQVHYDIYKFEISKAFHETKVGDEAKKQVNAAQRYIDENNEKLFFLMELITKE